ncbi:MAG: leucine--tRNA ligase [Parachlamydiales bacterium]|nr:leucine--tRNA ligase [Parachlamydiales bacterium]
MDRYDHHQIEPKWQQIWQEKDLFAASNDQSKPKYYVLDMFPYPSGSGLHVGHPVGYTATDIIARFRRHEGFNVLHPMGWDSFGLPAEQYAIRTGTHPAKTTKLNVETFKRQLKRLGFSYDWDREIATSDPKYYKWTQWIFTLLYEQGLAYEAEMLVNFCPALGTVLANEEIDNGFSKEGHHPVERRPLRQWILKITEYAERLLQDLDTLDWPDSLKRLQSNWIGKSEGVVVNFLVDETAEELPVFTTRGDTLFGVTYVTLSPEHPLVAKVTTSSQKEVVQKYCTEASKKSDLERQELTKTKTGVWTGAFAINPVNHEKIPIWVSDYVLMGYGTGAVMAVPAHDERDFEFAKTYKLPIKLVINPDTEDREAILSGSMCWTGDGKCINSHHESLSLDQLSVQQAKERVAHWLEKENKGRKTINYKLRDWLFSRQRYWGEPVPILHFADGSKRALALDELPLLLPEVDQYKPTPDGLSPLAAKKEWVEIIDPKTGKPALRETNTMPNWAGSCWYYLRFIDPHNDNQAWDLKKEQYWGPVDLYVGGVEHAVLHLLYSRFWHKVLFDLKLVHTSEPFQALRNQGLVTSRSYQKENGSYVELEDVIEKDGKYYHKTTNELLQSQIEKMSKSKLNGVSPDTIIKEFGADSLRVYLMFLGPIEKEKVWNTEAVNGARRFLSRFFDVCTSDKVKDQDTEEALKLGHRLIKGVKEDIGLLHFNTAIAKMMTFLNDFSKLPIYSKSVLKMACLALSPFAPHLAEEMWQHLGSKESIMYEPFPKVIDTYLEDSTVVYIVQVNGKVRGTFELPKNQTKESIMQLAKEHPQISKHLEGDIKKLIFVPDRLLNFVIA